MRNINVIMTLMAAWYIQIYYWSCCERFFFLLLSLISLFQVIFCFCCWFYFLFYYCYSLYFCSIDNLFDIDQNFCKVSYYIHIEIEISKNRIVILWKYIFGAEATRITTTKSQKKSVLIVSAKIIYSILCVSMQ